MSVGPSRPLAAQGESSAPRPTAIGVLALDFDGVICDSIDECLLTSHRAYRALRPAVTPAVEVPETLRRMFYARRGYVRPSGHYYLLWKWITEFPDRQLSAREFEALEAADPGVVETFEHEFHATRDAFRATETSAWLALNPLYPDVAKTWPALLTVPLYIVTTKDRASVESILSAHSLAVSGIFARGEMKKADALRAICRQHDVAPADVAFVDDNALHLKDAQVTGVTACLAAWGYGPSIDFGGAVLRQFADVAILLQSTKPHRA